MRSLRAGKQLQFGMGRGRHPSVVRLSHPNMWTVVKQQWGWRHWEAEKMMEKRSLGRSLLNFCHQPTDKDNLAVLDGVLFTYRQLGNFCQASVCTSKSLPKGEFVPFACSRLCLVRQLPLLSKATHSGSPYQIPLTVVEPSGSRKKKFIS